jgi:TonB family protein
MKTSPSIDVLHRLSESPKIPGMIFLSLGLHVVMISAMFLLPNLSSSRTFYSPVYSVRLVNVAPSFSPTEAEVPKRSSEVLPSGSKPSLSPAKKEDSEKKITLAIERLRSKKEASQLSSAIEGLRGERETRQVSSAIEGTRREKEASQVSSSIEGLRKEAYQLSSSIEGLRRLVIIGSSGAVETGEEGSGGASSAVMSIKFKIYYNLLWQRIHSVWVLPEEVLGGKKNLETIIAIRITQDGQIEDIQFEKRSGNPYLDESALRAIKKANPLPPLPPGIGADKFDVGVRFTPSDL